MLLSVVIPAHNAERYVGDQLAALSAQVDGGTFEVILVDNLSTDRTVEIAAEYSETLNLRIVTAGAKPSATYARNVGVASASGEFIVFVDADDVVDPSLLATYRANTSFHQIMGGYVDHVRLNDPKVSAWRPEEPPDGLPLAYGTVPYFMMGNSAIHRSVFAELGGFDENLPHAGEEVDFSIRAKLVGYEIGWVPDAVVYYRHRPTLRGLSKQFFHFGRGTTYVYARHRDRADLRPTTRRQAGEAFRAVFPHVVDIACGNRRRGRWVRLTSCYAGQALESWRQRVWYLG